METNIVLPTGINACPKPKMSDHAGRCWDQCDVILPDGSTITGWLETVYGKNFYFPFADRWRKASIDRFDTHNRGGNVFDLRVNNAV